MKKDWSHYGWIAVLPLLAVVILYATEIAARGSFFTCGFGRCESIPERVWEVLRTESETNSSPTNLEARKLAALKYGGRMTWYLFGELYLFVCAAALAVAAILTYQLVPKRPFVGVLVVLTVALIVGRAFYANPEMHMAVFLVLFENAIKPDVPAIQPMTNFFNSLGNAAAFALLLTSCATLLPAGEGGSPEEIKQLAKRMKALRLVLYTGTVLLVLTLLLKKSVYQWALAYTSQEAEALEAARIFVASLLTMDGGFYTLVLAAAYLPAALVLQRRAQISDGLPDEESEAEKKLKEYGITASMIGSFPRLLAILGPLLVGPLGELLNAVVK